MVVNKTEEQDLISKGMADKRQVMRSRLRGDELKEAIKKLKRKTNTTEVYYRNAGYKMPLRASQLVKLINNTLGTKFYLKHGYSSRPISVSHSGLLTICDLFDSSRNTASRGMSKLESMGLINKYSLKLGVNGGSQCGFCFNFEECMNYLDSVHDKAKSRKRAKRKKIKKA